MKGDADALPTSEPGVILVVGRPAVGKTGIGLSRSLAEAHRRGRPSHFFSAGAAEQALLSRREVGSRATRLITADDQPALCRTSWQSCSAFHRAGSVVV